MEAGINTRCTFSPHSNLSTMFRQQANLIWLSNLIFEAGWPEFTSLFVYKVKSFSGIMTLVVIFTTQVCAASWWYEGFAVTCSGCFYNAIVCSLASSPPCLLFSAVPVVTWDFSHIEEWWEKKTREIWSEWPNWTALTEMRVQPHVKQIMWLKSDLKRSDWGFVFAIHICTDLHCVCEKIRFELPVWTFRLLNDQMSILYFHTHIIMITVSMSTYVTETEKLH